MSQVIIFGQTGQTLRHVPPARVTSATYAIEDLTLADDDVARVIASGAATVASWSITTSATAGPTQSNPKRMSTAHTSTAAVRDAAAIVAVDGSAEIFEVAAVREDTYIEAETALAGVYASGSTVYGIEISASVPNTLVSNSAWDLSPQVWARPEDILEQRRPLRVVWTYTIGSATIKAQELISFVRHTTAATINVGKAVLSVRKLYPDLPGRLPDYADLDEIARELAEKIADAFRERGIRPEQFLAGPSGRELLELRIVAHAAVLDYSPQGRDPESFRTESSKAYQRRFEALVVGEPGEAVVETNVVPDTATQNPSHEYRGPTLRM